MSENRDNSAQGDFEKAFFEKLMEMGLITHVFEFESEGFRITKMGEIIRDFLNGFPIDEVKN